MVFSLAMPALAGGFSIDVNPAQAVKTVTNASQQFAVADPERNYVIIQNRGSVSILVTFGAAVSTAGTEAIEISAGGAYEPAKGIRDTVNMKTTSGTNTQVVLLMGR